MACWPTVAHAKHDATMKTEDAFRYFETKAELARQLGIGRASLSSWGPLVPPLRAMILEKITGGKLKFDENAYRDYGRPGARARRARAAGMKLAGQVVESATHPSRRAPTKRSRRRL